jgi:hypothetical protein
MCFVFLLLAPERPSDERSTRVGIVRCEFGFKALPSTAESRYLLFSRCW